MKIALLGQKGFPMKFGGIEKHVESLALGLSERGHEVFVYTRPWYTEKSWREYRGVNLISLPSLKTKHLDAISHTLLATLHALFQDYDVIHYHGVGPALLAWIPRIFKPRIKVVATFHCIDRFHQKWNWFARLALRFGERAAVKFAHETITVSQTLRQYCALEYNRETAYIPNGVELADPSGDEALAAFGLRTGEYLLFMSRLVKHKAAHTLIEAYKKIKTDKKLVIAGGSAFTDEYVESLKALADGNPNIIFTGNVAGGSELWHALYSNAYLFVHPSESEGLPMVVLEAMSFGLPVLVSNIPENTEAIANSTGFIFEVRNVLDLKKKIEFLLGQPELAKQTGALARAHVINHYNWQDIIQSTVKLYLATRSELKIRKTSPRGA